VSSWSKRLDDVNDASSPSSSFSGPLVGLDARQVLWMGDCDTAIAEAAVDSMTNDMLLESKLCKRIRFKISGGLPIVSAGVIMEVHKHATKKVSGHRLRAQG
jgi:hypothetical protein